MPLLIKNTLMKIRKTSGRYLSLFLIILVGVGFFAGVRVSAPDLKATLSNYNQEFQLMDLKVVSTMGLTDDDVAAIAGLPGVAAAIPSYSLDALAGENVVRVHGLLSDVNAVSLTAGRLPQSDDECVADAEHYQIGDVIKLSDVESDLKHGAYTVVGTVASPLYIADDYGSTTEGAGELYSFLFVNEHNFTLDTYTEIYVKAASGKEAVDFSTAYRALIDAVTGETEGIEGARETARYQEIYDEAAQTIDDSEQTLDEEASSAGKTLADAKAQLDAGSATLQSAKATLAEQEAQLNKTEEEQNAVFAASREQLNAAWNQVDVALANNGLSRDTLGGQVAQLSDALGALQEQLAQYETDSLEYAALSEEIAEKTAVYHQLLALENTLQTLSAQEEQWTAGSAAFQNQITVARGEIAAGKETLRQKEAELNSGYGAYHDGLSSYQTEIAEAKDKIAEAKEELATIARPQWTVLERDDVIAGYSDLKNGTDTITAVAAVLPLFFILIVVLMTSNTMVRMIGEERSEIGALTSLGFRDAEILRGYLIYVLSATVLGVVSGYFLGCTVIPYLIANCFPYLLPPLILKFDAAFFFLILLVAVALMSGVTVLFCKGELKRKPAVLLRPAPPQKGQKILLENFGFLWNHLSFTWKVTLRNIFRYKRRVFMTIIGISGCTALLLAGFGVKDCLNGVAEAQYGDIFRYDQMIVLKDDVTEIDPDLDHLLAQGGAEDPALLQQAAVTCISEAKSLQCYLIVPEKEAAFSQYYHLTAESSGENLRLSDQGVTVTAKIAEIYGVASGDTLTIQNGDGGTYDLPVAAVAENYIGNYIYLNQGLYQDIFGEAAAYNMIVSAAAENFSAQKLLDDEAIVNVTASESILQQARQGSESLNGVVLLIVVVASLLAVIVLYNLTSINISERKREIATLKVLGFYDGETNAYIYREAFLLALISIVIGLFLGVGLHRFLMSVIEQDAMIYFDMVKALSYLWAFLITLVASVLMQVITYFKLKKINMIESLKSVE
ncbi:MAG TPA: FtsX-like permease family protein [Clostridiales bacterium]|nr:FtsX-like permease family protein [Clostridiales bacterium]